MRELGKFQSVQFIVKDEVDALLKMVFFFLKFGFLLLTVPSSLLLAVLNRTWGNRTWPKKLHKLSANEKMANLFTLNAFPLFEGGK